MISSSATVTRVEKPDIARNHAGRGGVKAFMFGMMSQAGRDAFDFWQRAAETAAASAYVIDRRSRLFQPGRMPTPADLAEMNLMITEKLTAFGLANLALVEAWCAGTMASWATCGEALAPIHERATANARRLRKRRRL